jgi:hypothetical protein
MDKKTAETIKIYLFPLEAGICNPTTQTSIYLKQSIKWYAEIHPILWNFRLKSME